MTKSQLIIKLKSIYNSESEEIDGNEVIEDMFNFFDVNTLREFTTHVQEEYDFNDDSELNDLDDED